ncbi:hypothetical protein A3F55_00715 [Candidatus Adlerbacteria bacterium RIFCSPHIGHO2_12_FULL_53_18]|uniref:Transglutaminase-like domain-containing protein n=1 Tax=Candidatus Adlerbacteria bacterium RIFCSPHIGHO2_12_FULL_53_18 TaxID=1797242 RepID=A0A1F4XVZ4_9BACT|nr:MAG: hypothetical protein A3F55_00715 [Candidatus Adlerbacteria bacterium RIFCSPHIGHO2_12_FULL_53_18]
MSPTTRTYQKKFRALLSPAEHKLLKKLSTPQRVQDYLEALPQNFSKSAGETCRSVRRILQKKRAYCFEGAILAAASLAYHGKVPLLLDLQTTDDDQDHVLALFKENGRWGAISKTNNPVLRWRDPVYTSVRELAMSYFHEYFLYKSGIKTMRAYSKPFDLTKYKPEVWVTGAESLDFIAEDLDDSPHFPAVSPKAIKKLRRATTLERKILDLEEWEK